MKLHARDTLNICNFFISTNAGISFVTNIFEDKRFKRNEQKIWLFRSSKRKHPLKFATEPGDLDIDFSRRTRTITEDDYRILVSPGCNARPSPSTISLCSRISPRPTTSFTIDFRRQLSYNLLKGHSVLHINNSYASLESVLTVVSFCNPVSPSGQQFFLTLLYIFFPPPIYIHFTPL